MAASELRTEVEQAVPGVDLVTPDRQAIGAAVHDLIASGPVPAPVYGAV